MQRPAGRDVEESSRLAHLECVTGLTPARFEPILIYRKEDRRARADRAGTGFVDNSIALRIGGKLGAGPRAANSSRGVVGSHPLPPPRCR
nr:MAG TPA: hypothetical protein [Caudoviricetes sp.]